MLYTDQMGSGGGAVQERQYDYSAISNLVDQTIALNQKLADSVVSQFGHDSSTFGELS